MSVLHRTSNSRQPSRWRATLCEFIFGHHWHLRDAWNGERVFAVAMTCRACGRDTGWKNVRQTAPTDGRNDTDRAEGSDQGGGR